MKVFLPIMLSFLFLSFSVHAQRKADPCNHSVFINYEDIHETMTYPKWMFKYDISGYITAYGEVDTNGYMHNILLAETYCDEFNDVATNALRTVRHKPAVVNCRPVARKIFAKVWLATQKYSRLPKVDLLMSNYSELLPSKSGKAVGRFYYQRGLQLYRMGEDSLAQLDFYQALGEMGDVDLPYYDVAIYEDIQHILPQNVENSDSLENRAYLLSSFCLHTKAIECYDTLIQRTRYNNEEMVRYKLLQSYSYKQLKMYDKAIEQTLPSVLLHPGNDGTITNLGWLYYLAGKYDSCLYYTQKAINLRPQSMMPFFNYALCHLRTGKVVKAVELYKDAIVAANKQEYSLTGAIDDIVDLIRAKVEVEAAKELLINYFNVKEKSLWKLLKL